MLMSKCWSIQNVLGSVQSLPNSGCTIWISLRDLDLLFGPIETEIIPGLACVDYS